MLCLRCHVDTLALAILLPPLAVALGHEALAAELRALSTLHKYGCGSRVVRPLATVQWPGDWTDDEEDRRRTWCIVSAPGAL